jgi:hypothetical protein
MFNNNNEICQWEGMIVQMLHTGLNTVVSFIFEGTWAKAGLFCDFNRA